MNPGRSQADELRVETSLLEEGGHVEDVLVSLHGNARFSVQVKQTELLALGHRQVEFVAHLIDAVLYDLQHATEITCLNLRDRTINMYNSYNGIGTRTEALVTVRTSR